MFNPRDTARCQSCGHFLDGTLEFCPQAKRLNDELKTALKDVTEGHRRISVFFDNVSRNVEIASKASDECEAVFNQLELKQRKQILERKDYASARDKINRIKSETPEIRSFASMMTDVAPSLAQLEEDLKKYSDLNNEAAESQKLLRKTAGYKKWKSLVLGEFLHSSVSTLLLAATDRKSRFSVLVELQAYAWFDS